MAGRGGIVLHTEEDFKHLRAAGQLAAATLDMITPYVKPGVTTGELDRIIHAYTLEHGATPGPLNYRGYPKSCCISVNHVVCHGIPGDRPLIEGDIVNIDVTPKLNGWFGDTSRMYTVGKVSIKAAKLITTTYESLMRGIEVVRPGATLGDIATPFRATPKNTATPLWKIFAGMGSGRFFMPNPTSCTTAAPARA